MRHKIVSVCLLVCLLLMLPTTAFAQTFDAAREGSVAVTLMERKDKTPIVGAELSLYYVASVTLNGSERLNYTYTAAFENCGTFCCRGREGAFDLSSVCSECQRDGSGCGNAGVY